MGKNQWLRDVAVDPPLLPRRRRRLLVSSHISCYHNETVRLTKKQNPRTPTNTFHLPCVPLETSRQLLYRKQATVTEGQWSVTQPGGGASTKSDPTSWSVKKKMKMKMWLSNVTKANLCTATEPNVSPNLKHIFPINFLSPATARPPADNHLLLVARESEQIFWPSSAFSDTLLEQEAVVFFTSGDCRGSDWGFRNNWYEEVLMDGGKGGGMYKWGKDGGMKRWGKDGGMKRWEGWREQWSSVGEEKRPVTWCLLLHANMQQQQQQQAPLAVLATLAHRQLKVQWRRKVLSLWLLVTVSLRLVVNFLLIR